MKFLTIELAEDLAPNEQVDQVMVVREGNTFHLYAIIKVWDSASIHDIRYAEVKVVNQ